MRAQELGQAQAAASSARGEPDRRAEARRAQLEAGREGGAAGPLDLDQWSAGQAAYQTLRGRESDAARDLQVAEAEVETARGAYLTARNSGRTLDAVRVRRLGEWARDTARSEQAALDESSSRRGGAR